MAEIFTKKSNGNNQGYLDTNKKKQDEAKENEMYD